MWHVKMPNSQKQRMVVTGDMGDVGPSVTSSSKILRSRYLIHSAVITVNTDSYCITHLKVAEKLKLSQEKRFFNYAR